MKKNCLILLLASIFLLTACTKNYTSVSNYYKEMKKIQSDMTSYFIETQEQFAGMNTNRKTYSKGNKWKMEITTKDFGQTMIMLYDGQNLWSYVEGSNFATTMPKEDMGEIEKNPALQLMQWYDNRPSSTYKFVKNNDKKNGFECRLIQIADKGEVCVSDKYGIAVYKKMTVENPKNPSQKIETVFNLIKIDTSDLDDSMFKLPEGYKKFNMQNMIKKMPKGFKQ